MKRKFVKVMFFGALALSTVTYVGCKDYDDDITEINANADGLSKQLEALQTALGQANAAAKAAADDAKAALDKANQAEAAAALAKEAAANAKAEAIQAAIDQLKPLIDGKASQEDLAKLAGRIEAIEKSLNNIDLTDVNKQLGELKEQVKALETIKNQIKALEAFKTALENAKITDRLGAVESSVKELKTLESSVKANTKSIEAIQAELKGISAKISSAVSNAVNTIAATMTNRLSSVTLIPDLYVDGIPTIEFVSAKYNKQVFQNNRWVDGKDVVSVSNNETSADYRMNPGTLKNEDIDINNLKYVHRIAESRAEAENAIVNVYNANIGDNGVLTVKLGKSVTTSLNLDNKKIYTVSLKVPVASKHLFTENGEQSAMVYSEFTRLAETYFKPELAFISGKYDVKDAYNASINSHMYADSLTLMTSSAAPQHADDLVAIRLPYDKESNLFDYIDGCKFVAPDKHTAMTRADLQKYGFDISFRKMTVAYAPTEDKANQEDYVNLSGDNNSIVTPKGKGDNTNFNQVAVGKLPILAATLYDKVNKNIIEQRYFKIQFVAQDPTPITIPWTDCVSAGKACEGATFDFTWDEMSKRVLEKLNDGKGMSKEDFNKIYSNDALTITPANDDNGTLNVTIVENVDASIPYMVWSLTPEQLGKLKVGDNKVVVKKTVTFVDKARLHPNVVLNLEWTVTTKVDATTLGKTDNLKWVNNTMKVYPVPMAIPYDDGKASYMTNILEGRYQPYVTGLLSCAKYDVNYSATGNPVYPGEALILESGFAHWNFTAANQSSMTSIYYTIANTAAGKNLVSNGGTIKIDWSTDINGLSANRYVFGTTNLQIVKILTLNIEANVSITDNSRQQTIANIGKYLTLTDAYGNLVAEEPTVEHEYAADYYKYYGIKSPVFGDEIKVADNAEGTSNVRTLESLNMTANVDQATNDLTFQNNGAPLQANAYLIVPVTVEHLWGTLTGHLAIPLNKSNAPLNVSAK